MADGNEVAGLADDALHKLLLDRDPLTGPDLASQPTLSSAHSSGSELGGGFGEVGLTHDGVAAVDGLGLVARHLRRDGARDPGALQAADRRPAEIVEESPGHTGGRGRVAGHTGGLTGRSPAAVEGPDRLASTVLSDCAREIDQD